MGLSFEDRIFIKNLYELKHYGAKRLMKEFPSKQWKKSTLNYYLKHLRETGVITRKEGSGRPKSARTVEAIADVNDLVLSQEGKPKTHCTTRQIARKTGLHQATVVRIIHDDLQLKCLKKRQAQQLTAKHCETRLDRANLLLVSFPVHAVDFIFFTDEKIFSVAPPVNMQNDRLYVPVATKKKEVDPERLLRTRPTFSKSVMVSVAVSKLGLSDVIFVEPGVKVNGAYYRDVLLAQHMLPAIRRIAGDCFVFQQDNAPAHRARETVQFLQRETPSFIPPDMWPPNSPDLNPVDYKIWGYVQEQVYQKEIHDVHELKQRLVEVWGRLPQNIVNKAIDEWRKRLRACVRAEGCHFEHIL